MWGRVPGSHHSPSEMGRGSGENLTWLSLPGPALPLFCLWPEAVTHHAAARKRIPDFIHSSHISTWPGKHGAKQIRPISRLGWLPHFLQAAKVLININCRSFLTLLEKVPRFLVEQKLTGTRGRCWRNGEGHGDLSYSQVCTNHQRLLECREEIKGNN